MYNRYFGVDDFDHQSEQKTGVLLVNLGTPEAPTTRALRPYLREFLSDPRVIEVSPLRWRVVLNFFILPFRPKRSAALYRNIWTEQGSPLLANLEQQAAKLSEELTGRGMGGQVEVALAMRIGSPSIQDVLRDLARKNVTRLLVIPLFPQYSGTTTGSVFDGIADELRRWRWVPELRFVANFHDHHRYIAALVDTLGERWSAEGRPDKLVFSFHGIPKRYFLNGDPYFCQCHKTARLVAEALALDEDDYVVAFQSRFGREEWLKPYTDELVASLPASGVHRIDVVCPGFTSDCLETLDEIDRELRETFIEQGGTSFRYIPCLNARPLFIEMLADLCEEHGGTWFTSARDAAKADRLAHLRARFLTS